MDVVGLVQHGRCDFAGRFTQGGRRLVDLAAASQPDQELTHLGQDLRVDIILDLGYLKCIDTGCGFGGLLTALDVASGRTWQADEAGRVVTED